MISLALKMSYSVAFGRIRQTKNTFSALGESQGSGAKKDKAETRPKG
jgi:hypothetical protein